MTVESDNNNNKRINFNESIPDMIERLKREHRSFESKLDEANNNINRDNNIEGIKIIHDMSESVEEFIMQSKKKCES